MSELWKQGEIVDVEAELEQMRAASGALQQPAAQPPGGALVPPSAAPQQADTGGELWKLGPVVDVEEELRRLNQKEGNWLLDTAKVALSGAARTIENNLRVRKMMEEDAQSEMEGMTPEQFASRRPESMTQIMGGDPGLRLIEDWFGGKDEEGEPKSVADRIAGFRERVNSGLSEKGQDRAQSFVSYIDENGRWYKPWTWDFKDGATPWEDPYSWWLFVAENAPQLAISMGSSAIGGRVGANRAVNRLTPQQMRNPAAVRAEASKGATRGGIAAGTITEGILIRDAVATETKDRLMELPDELWNKNSEYVQMLESGEVSPEEAKNILSSQIGLKSGAVASILSAPLGAPAGALFGKMGAGITRNRWMEMLKGLATEGITEGFQETTETFVGNLGVRQIDPDQDITENGLNAFFGGALVGGPVGGIGGLLSGSVNEVGQTKPSRGLLDDKDVNGYLEAARKREHMINRLGDEAAVAALPVAEKKALYDEALDIEHQEAKAFIRAEPKLRKKLMETLGQEEGVIERHPEIRALNTLKAKYVAQLRQTEEMGGRLKADREALKAAKRQKAELDKIKSRIDQKSAELTDVDDSIRFIETVQDGGALAPEQYQSLIAHGYGRWRDKDQSGFVITQQGRDALPGLKETRAQIQRGMQEGYIGKERRKDHSRRQAIEQMSETERQDAVFRDSKTGLLNSRALESDEAAEPPAAYAKIDADSLKWVNDNMGDEAGDAMLKAIASAIEEAAGDAGYRTGGDEFIVTAESPEQAREIAEAVKDALSRAAPVSADLMSMQPKITFGVGTTKSEADAEVRKHKVRRTKEGKRADRAQPPVGLKRFAEELRGGDTYTTAQLNRLLSMLDEMPADEGALDAIQNAASEAKKGEAGDGPQLTLRFEPDTNVVDLKEARERLKSRRDESLLMMFAPPNGVNLHRTIWTPEFLLEALGDFDWDSIVPKKMPAQYGKHAKGVPVARVRVLLEAILENTNLKLSEIESSAREWGFRRDWVQDTGTLTTSWMHGILNGTTQQAWVYPNTVNSIMLAAALASGKASDGDMEIASRQKAQAEEAASGSGASSQSLSAQLVNLMLQERLSPVEIAEIAEMTQKFDNTTAAGETIRAMTDAKGLRRFNAGVAAHLAHTLGLPTALPETNEKFLEMVDDLIALTDSKRSIARVMGADGVYAMHKSIVLAIERGDRSLWGVSYERFGQLINAVTTLSSPDTVAAIIAKHGGNPEALVMETALPGAYEYVNSESWVGPKKVARLTERAVADMKLVADVSSVEEFLAVIEAQAERIRGDADAIVLGPAFADVKNLSKAINAPRTVSGMTLDTAKKLAGMLNIEIPGITDRETGAEALLELLSVLPPMSQSKLAELSGITQSGISMIFSRLSGGVKLDTFFRLRNAANTLLDAENQLPPLKMEMRLSKAARQKMRQRAKKQDHRVMFPRATPREMERATRVVMEAAEGMQNLPPITLVSSVDELTSRMRAKLWAQGQTGAGVQGFFDQNDPSNGVWIIVGNNRNVFRMQGGNRLKRLTLEQAVIETFFHEVVGHAGIRGLLGSDAMLDKYWEAVVRSMPNEVDAMTRKRFRKGYAQLSKSEQRVAFEEFIAHQAGEVLAERSTLSDEQLNVFQKFMNWVRAKLAELGFARFMFGPLKFTDRDIMRLIQKAEDFIRNGNAWTYHFSTGEAYGPLFMRDKDMLRSTVREALDGDFVEVLGKNDRKARIAAGKPEYPPLIPDEAHPTKYLSIFRRLESTGMQRIVGKDKDGRPVFDVSQISKPELNASGLMEFLERGSLYDLIEVMGDVSVIPQNLLDQMQKLQEAAGSANSSTDPAVAEYAAFTQELYENGHFLHLPEKSAALIAQKLDAVKAAEDGSAKEQASREYAKAIQDAFSEAPSIGAPRQLMDKLAAMRKRAEESYGKNKRKAEAELRAFQEQLFSQRMSASPLLGKSFTIPKVALQRWLQLKSMRVQVTTPSGYTINTGALQHALQKAFPDSDGFSDAARADMLAEIERDAANNDLQVGRGVYGGLDILPRSQAGRRATIRPSGNAKLKVDLAENTLTFRFDPTDLGQFDRYPGRNALLPDVVGGPVSFTMDSGPVKDMMGLLTRNVSSRAFDVVSSSNREIVLRPVYGTLQQGVNAAPGDFNLEELAKEMDLPLTHIDQGEIAAQAYTGNRYDNYEVGVKTGDIGLDPDFFKLMVVRADRGNRQFAGPGTPSDIHRYFSDGKYSDKNTMVHLRLTAAFDASGTPARNPLLGTRTLYIVEAQQNLAQAVPSNFVTKEYRQSVENNISFYAGLLHLYGAASLRNVSAHVNKALAPLVAARVEMALENGSSPAEAVSGAIEFAKDAVQTNSTEIRNLMTAMLGELRVAGQTTLPSGQVNNESALSQPLGGNIMDIAVMGEDARLMDHLEARAVNEYLSALSSIMNDVTLKLDRWSLNGWRMLEAQEKAVVEGLDGQLVVSGNARYPTQAAMEIMTDALGLGPNGTTSGLYHDSRLMIPRAVFNDKGGPPALMKRLFDYAQKNWRFSNTPLLFGSDTVAAVDPENMPAFRADGAAVEPFVSYSEIDWRGMGVPPEFRFAIAEKIANRLNNNSQLQSLGGSAIWRAGVRKESDPLMESQRGAFMSWHYTPYIAAVSELPVSVAQIQIIKRESLAVLKSELQKPMSKTQPSGHAREQEIRQHRFNRDHFEWVNDGFFWKHPYDSDPRDIMNFDSASDENDLGLDRDELYLKKDPDDYEIDDWDGYEIEEGDSRWYEAKKEAFENERDNWDEDTDGEFPHDSVDDWDWDESDNWIEAEKNHYNIEARREATQDRDGNIWDQIVRDVDNAIDYDPPEGHSITLQDADGDDYEFGMVYTGVWGDEDDWSQWIINVDGSEVGTGDNLDEAVEVFLGAIHDTIGAGSAPDFFMRLGSEQKINATGKPPTARSIRVRAAPASASPLSEAAVAAERERAKGFTHIYKQYVSHFKTKQKLSGTLSEDTTAPEPPLDTAGGYSAAAKALIVDAVRQGFRKIQWGPGEETTFRGGLTHGGVESNRIEWDRHSYVQNNGQTKEAIYLKVFRSDGYEPIGIMLDMNKADKPPSPRMIQMMGRAAAEMIHADYHGTTTEYDVVTPTAELRVRNAKQPSEDDVSVERLTDTVFAVVHNWSGKVLGQFPTQEEAQNASVREVAEASTRGYWFSQEEVADAGMVGGATKPKGVSGVLTDTMLGGPIGFTMGRSISATGGPNAFSPTNTSSARYHGVRLGYDFLLVKAFNDVLKPYKQRVKIGRRVSTSSAVMKQQTEATMREASLPIESVLKDVYGDIYIQPLRAGGRFVLISDKKGLVSQESFGNREEATTALAEAVVDLKGQLRAQMGIGANPATLAAAPVYEVEITDEMVEAFKNGTPMLSLNSGPSQYDIILSSVAKKIGARKKPLKQRYEEMTQRWKDRWMQGMFDKFHGLKAALRDAGLGGLPAEDNPYVQARLTTSLDSVMRAVMEFGHPIWEDGIVATEGRGLLEILAPVSDKLDLWGMYMAGVRSKRLALEGINSLTPANRATLAQEVSGLAGGSFEERVWTMMQNPANAAQQRYADALRESGRERLFTPQEIQRMVELGDEYPSFKNVARDYADFNRRVLDFAQIAGVINPDTRAIWEHADYVPFYRLNDDRLQGPLGQNIGIAGVKSPVKTLKGGEQNVGDIVHNIMINTTNLIDSAMKNHAAKMAVDALAGVGLVNKMPWKMESELIPMSQIEKILRQHGINPALVPPAARAGLQKMFAVKPPSGDGVIPIMREGKREFWYTDDPLLYQSMTMINMKQWGQWMNLVRAPKRLLTQMITLDPGFMIANFFRDLLGAFVVSRDTYDPFSGALRGMKTAIMTDDTFRRMLSAGAAFESGYVNAYDPNAVHRAIKKAGRSKDFVSTVLNSPRALFEAWRTIGSAVENANRIAIYNAAISAGKSKAQAAFESKDIMDFSMGGAWPAIQFLIQSVPFMGARLQGLHRLGRGAAENPLAFALKGTLLTMAGLALWFQYKDDERYKELQEWDKDVYFHWWIGDKHYRLPKPFEVGAIFNTLPERAFEFAYSKENDAGKLLMNRFGFMLAETFNFNPVPQAIMPATETIFNRSFFTGRQIVSHFESQRMGPEQYRHYTSPTMRELAKELPQWMDRMSDPPGKLRSPLYLQSLFAGYFGTLGRYALLASDAAVRTGFAYPSPPAWRTSDYPVLGRFARGDNPMPTKFEQEFYDQMTRMMQVKSSLSFLEKTGEIDRHEKLTEQEMAYVAISKPLESYRRGISEINAAMVHVYVDEFMTPQQKREQIDEYQQMKNELFREAFDLRPGGKNHPDTQPDESDVRFMLDKFGVDEMTRELATGGKLNTASLIKDVRDMSILQAKTLGGQP